MLSRRALLFASAGSLLRGQSGDTKMFGNAEAYERFMGRWSRLVAPPLIDFAGVPDEGRILDAGSGTGALAFAIGKLNKRVEVTGIDPSQEYVAFAAARNPNPGRMTFRVGDAQQLTFADRSFAAALSLLVFNFIPDPAKALRELCRVTKPKGRITAAVWDYGGQMRMLRAFWDAAVRTDMSAEQLDERYMPLCRAGELTQLWKRAGLEHVDEQPLEVNLNFSSFADYWDPFLLGQGPAGAYVRKLDRERVQALRSAVKRELSVGSETAAFSLPARVWAVRGSVPPS
jgi:SAM-dependent methyltransferase